jgi:hypothetical protein
MGNIIWFLIYYILPVFGLRAIIKQLKIGLNLITVLLYLDKITFLIIVWFNE